MLKMSILNLFFPVLSYSFLKRIVYIPKGHFLVCTGLTRSPEGGKNIVDFVPNAQADFELTQVHDIYKP